MLPAELEFIKEKVNEYLTETCVISEQNLSGLSSGENDTGTGLSVSDGMGGFIEDTEITEGETHSTFVFGEERTYRCRRTVLGNVGSGGRTSEFNLEGLSLTSVPILLILPADAEVYLQSQIAVLTEENEVVTYEVVLLSPHTDLVNKHVLCVEIS